MSGPEPQALRVDPLPRKTTRVIGGGINRAPTPMAYVDQRGFPAPTASTQDATALRYTDGQSVSTYPTSIHHHDDDYASPPQLRSTLRPGASPPPAVGAYGETSVSLNGSQQLDPQLSHAQRFPIRKSPQKRNTSANGSTSNASAEWLRPKEKPRRVQSATRRRDVTPTFVEGGSGNPPAPKSSKQPYGFQGGAQNNGGSAPAQPAALPPTGQPGSARGSRRTSSAGPAPRGRTDSRAAAAARPAQRGATPPPPDRSQPALSSINTSTTSTQQQQLNGSSQHFLAHHKCCTHSRDAAVDSVLLRSQLHAVQSHLAAAEKQIVDQESMVLAARAETVAAEKRIAELQTKLELAQQTELQLQKETDYNDRLVEKLEQRNAEVTSLTEKVAALEGALTSQRDMAASASNQARLAEDEALAGQEATTALLQDNEQLRERIAALEKQTQGAVRSHQQAADEVHQLRESAANHAAVRSEMLNAIADKEKRIAQLEGQLGAVAATNLEYHHQSRSAGRIASGATPVSLPPTSPPL